MEAACAGGENHECDGVDDCSVPTFTTGAVAGGAAVVMMLLWRAAMGKHGVWVRHSSTDVEMQKGA